MEYQSNMASLSSWLSFYFFTLHFLVKSLYSSQLIDEKFNKKTAVKQLFLFRLFISKRIFKVFK